MKAGLLLLAAFVGSAFAQQTPSRDTPGASAPAGTAVIRGVVISSDANPKPIRRARVALSGVPGGRIVITDDAGGFVFDALPAGRYTVAASKPAYLPAEYGAVQPGRPGTTIVLAEKQVADVSFAMSLGAVIGGVVRDARGKPMAGVDVGLVALPTVDVPRPSFTQSPATTDDRGEYRLYGVPPGRFYVAGVVQTFTPGTTSGRRTVEENDTLFAQLQARVNDANVVTPGAVAKRPASLPMAQTSGFAPIFYPSTTRMESASVVTVAIATERLGIDFVIAPVRAASLDGRIQGPVQNLDRVELSLVVDGPQFPSFSSSRPVLTQPPDKQGHFHYENVPPGRYAITARSLAGEGDPAIVDQFAGIGGGMSSGGGLGRTGGAPPEGRDYVYARADFDIDGDSVNNISLALAPGSTMSGKVQFDRTTAIVPADLAVMNLRVASVQPTSMSVTNNTAMGNSFLALPNSPVRADGTFIAKGIPPGQFNLTAALTAAISKDWWMRSATLNGRDLLDGPFDVQAGQDLSGVIVTLSDRHSELSGTLSTAAGKAATDYFVIVCPSDPKLWTPGSRRVRSLRPSSDGSFSAKDLPAGDYVIAAVTDVAPNEWNDPAWLALVAPSGAPVIISDGAKTVQNLKIGGSW